MPHRTSASLAGALAATLALLVLPGWGTGAPPIDWSALPATVVQVTPDVTAARCSELEPILCLSAQGAERVGGIEHLAFPLSSMTDVQAALAAGATVRQALEVEAASFHEVFAQGRKVGCPEGFTYRPDPTRPALVAGQPGMRYGFTVVDPSGRVVERSTTAMTILDDAVQLFVASGLADGACLPDEGYLFTPDGLADLEPLFSQLVAHALVPRAPHMVGTLVVPTGGDGVTYDEPDGPGELAVGPSALAVDTAGTTWVLDVEAQRLVRMAADGTLLSPVDLSAAGLQSLWDLDVRREGFVVLGEDPSGRSRLVLLDGDGAITAVHPLPPSADLASGLSGLAAIDDGVVLAELEGGARLVRVLDAQGAPVDDAVDDYTRHGHTYRVELTGAVRGLVIDDRLIEVRTDHDLVGLRWLGASPDGSAWIAVDELRRDVPGIEIDATVRRYAPDGRLLGSARMDLDQRHTVVQQPMTVAPDGTVVVLQTRPDHAEVVGLVLRDRLAPVFPPAEPVVHLTADNAVATAITLSAQAFPAGSTTHVMLGRDDVFADALAAGGAQGAVPLLLTATNELDDRVLAEIARLGAATVTVLGGEEAVSSDVVAALEAAGLNVDRLSGPTRVDTAVALARHIAPAASRAVIVRADGPDPSQAYADALAGGALAAWAGDPVLLTPTDGLAPAVASYLADAGVTDVIVAGGEAAVSAATVQAVEALGITVDRAGGPDRAATAVELASRRDIPTGLYSDRVILVDGAGWVDGLTAAALSARTGGPVLLSDGAAIPPATAAWLDAAVDRPAMVCTPSVQPTACQEAAS